MRVAPLFAGLVSGLALSVASAAEPDKAIREALERLQPGLPIIAIAESPLAGLYQVELQGGRQLYASADGQYLVQGYLFQVRDGQAVNLTEQAESKAVSQLIEAIPAQQMVVFPAKDDAKAHITVFTDTECGYCQKLHAEVPELNRRGIEVRYVAFPRQGLASPAYKELVSVWCAKDSRVAMNQAKSRQKVAEAECDNPVRQQYELGQMIGVQGTPAVVLQNGQIIPGYQPAPQLAQAALAAVDREAPAGR